MSDDLTVAVVIPAYNVEGVLGRAIDSVRAQTIQAAQLLVVDDGSTDGTAAVALRYPDVEYIHQENTGCAAARNSGIEAARTRWIAFLDADDVWKPHHLAEIGRVCRRHDLVWACGGHEEIGEDGQRVVRGRPSKWKRLLSNGEVFENYFEAHAARAPFQTSGMVIRREIFDELGLFDRSFGMGEDLDMWFRIAHKHPSIGFLWPASMTYLRCAESYMETHVDDASLFLRLLDRHVAQALSCGPHGVEMFRPIADWLELMTLIRAARDVDRESLTAMLRIPECVQGWRRMLIRLALLCPEKVHGLYGLWRRSNRLMRSVLG